MSRALPWDILWNRLIAITEEQAATLIRTALTPAVSEAGDLSAAVFDARGDMLAQAVTGTPGHINSLASAMRHFLAAYPADRLESGDVLITNDPWLTSGHYHDVTIVTPVFHRGRVVGYFGNICHTADIGGRVFSADARQVFEEGICIPIAKLFRAGVVNDDVIRIIAANVRVPDQVIGDLYAQAAGNDVGARRVVEMLEQFDLDDLDPIGVEIIGRSERAMREAILALPNGQYSAEGRFDGYDHPVDLKVTLRVQGDRIEADFAGTSPESDRGINVVLNYTHAYTTYALKAALSPEIPNNEGSFRPVDVRAPEGCILNCRRPAAVAARHIIGHFVPSLIFRALADALPDRILAESYDALWNTQWHGYDRDGRHFVLVVFNAGGMGARLGGDGFSATSFPSGVHGFPVEAIEAHAPLIYEARRLRIDSGGAGQWRGGLGHEIVARARDGCRVWLSPFFDRFNYPARGVFGGKPGASGSFTIDGVAQHPKATVELPAGSLAVISLPGGGGYGDPARRERASVACDIADGYVSRAGAADYE
ncbi:MAG: hydantoinase B/oxoprolinase family protein [Chloroflexota bacterium]|nr:MAG: hydantoinase B/oxoprolinase family protein [Chloroflexota bacterium]